MALLGDSIRYRPGAGVWRSFNAYVDYSDQLRSIDGAQLVEQNMTLSVLIAQIPAKPTGSARIELSAKPGKIYRPVNVGRDASGTHWTCELVLSNA